MNELASLKSMTKVVADTGDFAQIKRYQPIDATTNPSLLLKAVLMSEYDFVVKEALSKSAHLQGAARLSEAMIDIAVAFGLEILKVVPGKVSTEVDARLSFDTDATVKFARKVIEKYKEAGIDRSRVLIKIASTWEGIKAAEILEKEGVLCNLTLMFDIAQAIACAEAGVFLISPFVGRITDWYKKSDGLSDFPAVEKDQGVLSVKAIYEYYKTYGYKTVVMGASFRHVGQITALAGCDALTIAPDLLKVLETTTGELEQVLDGDKIKPQTAPTSKMTETEFRWQMNQSPMATEKLAEGIRKFAEDTEKLEALLEDKISGN
ncbi:transaldolase [Fangia hongkongensis]|uniref:transaldolase n=1 Tax=Fangia hongkongensis TaxID=270495 RepID=UPI0003769D0A|nr:transaldolase [Fangia hongkongensis]MBK2124311.1 transaldolase [Fangia hongkongensis]